MSSQQIPWYDREIEHLIKTKNYWYTKKRRHPTNELVRLEYNLARNKTTMKIRKKKLAYFQRGFSESLNDNKRTWKYLKEAIHNGKNNGNNDKILTNNNPKQ